MSVFFSSDLHIGHVNILKYSRSEFYNDLDEMKEALVSNWNSVVDPNDTVYILGDVVMGQRANNLPILDELDGSKHLILGNHDYPHPCNKGKIVDKWTPEYAKYFESMSLETVMEISGQQVLLTHFPASLDHADEIRYGEYRPVYDGIIMHGHLHCTEIFTEPNHIHIGIDADYEPYGVGRYHPVPLEVVQTLVERVSS